MKGEYTKVTHGLELSLQKQLDFLELKEVLFWKGKARDRFTKCGDKNIK